MKEEFSPNQLFLSKLFYTETSFFIFSEIFILKLFLITLQNFTNIIQNN